MKGVPWSPAEDAIIAEEIRIGKGWCVRSHERMPKRSMNAIQTRAYTANIMTRVRTESIRANIRQEVAAPTRVQTGANIPEYLRDLPIWDKSR